MVQILIDGRRAQGTRTGVGHYTKSIISHWPEKSTIEVLLTDSQPSETIQGVKTRILRGGVFWHLRAWMRAIKMKSLYFSPESFLVPILMGHRSLLTVHDLTPLDQPSMHKRWNVYVHRFGMRLAVARAGRIIVPTDAVRADLLRHFPAAEARASVIYEGVRVQPDPSTAAVEGFRPFAQPYALYIGTIEPRKNVIPLITSFLGAAPEEWQLVIVGKVGWLSDVDKAEFMALADHPRVHHLGFVPDSWIPVLLSDARVFCYVSDSEGFGLPVAEALAIGTPVIHSDDPALLEVADGAGIVVRRSRLMEDLRTALIEFTSMDDETVAELVEKGRDASRKYDWLVAASSTHSLVLELLGAER